MRLVDSPAPSWIGECPFCGSRVRVRKSPLAGGLVFMCTAAGCGADVMFYAGDGKGLEENARLWNRRAK